MMTSDAERVENERLRSEVAALTQALAESDRRFTVISENVADVIYICAPDGRIDYISPSISRLLGFTSEEGIGKGLDQQHMSPESRSDIEKALQKAARGDIDEATLEVQIETKAGQQIWCELHSRTGRDETGAVTEHYVVLRDISDRKATRDALIESERRYRLVSENVADVIYVFDDNGDCEYVSPSVERLFGLSPDDIVGQNFQDLHIDDEARQQSLEMSTKAKHGGLDEYRLESLHETADGEPIWTETSHRILRGPDGRMQSMHAVQRDVTEQKRLTTLLERERERLAARGERLDALNERLESFAAIVTHDLQGPLRRIERMLQRAEQAAEIDASLLPKIRSEALEMSEFVDHVLEVSRSHAQPLQRSNIDICALFAHVVDRATSETDRTCTTSLPDRTMLVQADPQLLRSVLDNIVGNAFKYVPADRALHLQLQIESHDGNEVISITDNGDGFTETIPDLTSSFHRGPNAASQPGHGIGLATVRTMIERHDGRLRLENDDQAGGRVVFTLSDADATWPGTH